MPVVSVIIPVYKSEECIEKAVRSVTNQSFSDFEILLIDDGSPDNSLEVCKRLSASDSRIKVYHKENGGICSARNYGLEKATAKYIAFLDHDDEYLPGYLDENIGLLEKYSADMIKFGRIHRGYQTLDVYRDLHDNKLINMLECYGGVKVFKNEEIILNYNKIRDAVKTMYIWDGIYSANLIKNNNILFDTGFKYGHEDNMFNVGVYSHAKTIVLHSKEYYIHNFDSNVSTSATFNPNRIGDAIKTVKAEQNMLTNWGCPEVEILIGIVNEFFRVMNIINLKGTKIKYSQKKEMIKLFINETLKNLPNIKSSIKELCKFDFKSGIWAFCMNKDWILLVVIMFKVYGLTLGRKTTI